jgi:hypothetical protein
VSIPSAEIGPGCGHGKNGWVTDEMTPSSATVRRQRPRPRRDRRLGRLDRPGSGDRIDDLGSGDDLVEAPAVRVSTSAFDGRGITPVSRAQAAIGRRLGR